jgi:drug/metabolite transporter (DMT)-like permease
MSPSEGRRGAAHLALIAVQLMFASLPIAAKLVLDVLPPAALVLFRIAGGFSILFAIGWARRPECPRPRDLGRLALLAALGVALNQLLYIEGLHRTTAINAQVIATTIPAFTLLCAVVFGVERATLASSVGIVLAAAGAICMIGPDRITLAPETTIGNLMIAVNALGYAAYLVLSKPMLSRYGSTSMIGWVFAFGALMVAPFGVVALAGSATVQQATTMDWSLVAFIVLVPTAGSYWLNAWALKRSPPSMVAAYVYLQPVLTAILAVLVLDESIGVRTLVGAGLIFGGVALSARR